MKRADFLRLSLLAAALPATALPISARAQDAPSRRITLLVGFPAGTSSDLMSRFLAERLQRRLGQVVVVENRPGADGNVAAAAVARARPDGTTLLYSTSSAHAANVSLYRNLGHDPLVDFTPISGVLRQPTVVLVRPDSPIRSVADLAAASRARAEGLSYGYGNSSTRIVGALLEQRAGVRGTAVAFRGNPQSLTELIAGRLDFAATDAFTGVAQVQAGALRAIAVSSEAPDSRLPGVPSLVQLGILEAPIVAWTGIFGPAGMTAALTTQIGDAVRAALAEEEGAAMLARLVADAFPQDSAALTATMRADIARWAGYVRLAGIEPI
jgi:tripartite-type tricarboxylate transporter receptor subunit TctC